MRNFFTALAATLLIVILSALEGYFVRRDFNELKEILTAVSDKCVTQTAGEDDGTALQTYWEERKRTIHIFIPHNDIREMDLWISESVYYLAAKDYEEALSKLQVLLDFCDHVPGIYRFRLENLF